MPSFVLGTMASLRRRMNDKIQPYQEAARLMQRFLQENGADVTAVRFLVFPMHDRFGNERLERRVEITYDGVPHLLGPIDEPADGIEKVRMTRMIAERGFAVVGQHMASKPESFPNWKGPYQMPNANVCNWLNIEKARTGAKPAPGSP